MEPGKRSDARHLQSQWDIDGTNDREQWDERADSSKQQDDGGALLR